MSGDKHFTSRVIIRNIPKYYDEVKVKEFIQEQTKEQLTDVRIPKNVDGKSRQLAFVGATSVLGAKNIISRLNKTYLDTCKLFVEPAFPPGSNQIPRPWSRHSKGSTANELQQKKTKTDVNPQEQVNKEANLSTEPRETPSVDDVKEEFMKVISKRKGQASWADDVGVKKYKLSSDAAKKSQGDPGPCEEDSANPVQKSTSYIEEGSSGSSAGDPSGSSSANALAWLREKSTISCDAELEDLADSLDNQQDGIQGGVGKETEKDAEHLEADVSETGRLLILNLPYTTTDEELKALMAPFGEVTEVHICMDETRVNSRGRAFVLYAFAEHAVVAMASLDGTIFQGRVIRVKAAQPPKEQVEVVKVQGKRKQAMSSYKKQQEERLKKTAEDVQTWNLLFVSANAAADAAVDELGVDKRSFLGLDDDDMQGSMAAQVALGETHIIQQTKRWLKSEGVNMNCFERTGASLLKSTAVDEKLDAERCDSTIICKHLPPSTTDHDIFSMFSKSGPLVRYCLAPSKTVAIVQFLEPKNAKKAFQRLSFSKFRNVPLLLEWAPSDVFVSPKPKTALLEPHTQELPTFKNEEVENETELIKEMLDKEDASHQMSTALFVKNLNFETTDETLGDKFKTAPGYLKATITKKRKIVQNGDSKLELSLSAGYGFVDFDTEANAKEALKRFQGVALDGHALELKVSERSASKAISSQNRGSQDSALESHELSKIDLSKVTNKVTVRNLAFQAVKKDLRKLFGAFGNVIAVRVPKKADGTSRGYGFVEFSSRSEALSAMEALQHTHLYGRKMIIEPAETTDLSIEKARAKQAISESAAKTTESKLRNTKGIIDADAKPFEDIC